MPAARDAVIVAAVLAGLVLFVAFATKQAPHALAWLAAACVVVVRFLLVAAGVAGRRTSR
jgi:hypothetical protein